MIELDTTVDVILYSVNKETNKVTAKNVTVLARKFGYLAICKKPQILPVFLAEKNPHKFGIYQINHVGSKLALPFDGTLKSLICFCEKHGNNYYWWKSKWNIKKYGQTIEQAANSCNLLLVHQC